MSYTKDDWIQDTVIHRDCVTTGINHAIVELKQRAEDHDLTKFEDEEAEGYYKAIPYLRQHETLPADIQCAFDRAWDHHKTKNDHHPEFYADGLLGMDFIVLIELASDWCAAMLRENNPQSIESNVKTFASRYHYPEYFATLLINTMKKVYPVIKERYQFLTKDL